MDMRVSLIGGAVLIVASLMSIYATEVSGAPPEPISPLTWVVGLCAFGYAVACFVGWFLPRIDAILYDDGRSLALRFGGAVNPMPILKVHIGPDARNPQWMHVALQRDPRLPARHVIVERWQLVSDPRADSGFLTLCEWAENHGRLQAIAKPPNLHGVW